MTSQEISQRICRKYERITGQSPVGLADILKILTGPDLVSDLKSLILMAEIESTPQAVQDEQDLCGVMSRGKLYGPCVLDEGHPRSEPHQDGLGKVFYRNES